jgi:ABC-2 type transport system ATP-binding protein
MLTLERVRKAYGSTVAVDDLSLSVRRGEILGLLGPNGAGKSTTVNLAVGLLPPDTGRVVIDGGGNPQSPSVRARLGVAPQALALYELLSGVENLRFFGEMYGLSGAALRHRVAWSLEFVGLTERSRDRVSDYSGGMKRRLNLASALVHDPELVLLDEPTVGVDPQSRHQIFENILDLKRQGCTLIYTTHYMEEAARLCDRVAILDKGRLLALGTVDELLSRYGARPTLVAQTDQGEHRVETDDPLAELNRLAAVGTVAAFQLERPTLEQVFLQLTGRSLRDWRSNQ